VSRAGVYDGWVRHRRYEPVEHAFGYRHALVGLDLADGQRLEQHPWFGWRRPAAVRFHRGDYLRPLEVPLDQAVRACVRQQTGINFDGSIEILTQPRAWGYSFNPVSFYLCRQADGRLAAIVADITSTPWLERHAYALAVPEDHPPGAPLDLTFAKRFHISPFNGMGQIYRWRFIVRDGVFAVHMRNLEGGHCVFDATLVLARHALNGGALSRLLRRSPLLNLQVVFRIYLHAKRLWAKRATFYPHPDPVPAGV